MFKWFQKNKKSDETLKQLDSALEEATLLGLELNEEKNIVLSTFKMLCCDSEGNIPDDRRVSIIFGPVGKIVASLIDVPEGYSMTVEESQALDKKSFEYHSTNQNGTRHTIDLFQSDLDKHLEIRIWFDNVKAFTPDQEEVPIETLFINAKNAWDHMGNQSIQDSFGLVPAERIDEVLRD